MKAQNCERHCTLQIAHRMLNRAHCTPHITQYLTITLCSGTENLKQCALQNAQCTLKIAYCTWKTENIKLYPTVYTAQSTLTDSPVSAVTPVCSSHMGCVPHGEVVQCTVAIVQCTVAIIHCTLETTLLTVHSKLSPVHCVKCALKIVQLYIGSV